MGRGQVERTTDFAAWPPPLGFDGIRGGQETGGMTTMSSLSYTILQGATFRERFRWCTCPYATRVMNNVLVNALTGRPVPDADLEPVDLAGCTGRMQLRSEVLAPAVLLELSTEDGRIDFSEGDGWIGFVLDDQTTSAIPYGESPPSSWCNAIGQLEVKHPNGDVSRPVGIYWTVDPEGTR